LITQIEREGKPLESKELNCNLASINQRSEQLKGDYRQTFIDWKIKFFTYKPKTYEYISNNSKERYTLADLHNRYQKAMLESPFNCS
jgi:tRNA uridine 5-carbamoylmethylation protein Kti12